MKDNEQYNYSYQPPINYAPYGYYSNPPYISNVNEQIFLQQPGAGYHDGVETQPDVKFFQPMKLSLGPQQYSLVNQTSSNGFDISISNTSIFI